MKSAEVDPITGQEAADLLAACKAQADSSSPATMFVMALRSGGEFTIRQLHRWSREPDFPMPVADAVLPRRRGRPYDKRCETCGAPFYATGHEDGYRCADSIIYAAAYGHDGMSIREVAERYETDYSHVRRCLLEAGVDLNGRGRRRKD